MTGSEEDLTDLKCDIQKLEEKFRSVVYVGGESAEVRNGGLTATFDATPHRINDSVYELYRPVPGSGNIDMEVVFFHGLRLGNSYNAHIDTWMSSSEPSECWIKTWLPQLFPRARILTASYDSSGIANGTYSSFDLYLIAEALAQDIILSAKVGQQYGTPVILVGHCIGGLVIKALCLHVEQSVSKLDKEARESFVENMTGVFFFATPQSGMKLKHLTDPGPLAESVQILGKSTARLNESFEDLRKSYGWTLHGLGESQPTRLRELQGIFEEEVLIVAEASCRPYLDEFMCIMGADHFSICRPKDMKSSTFDALVRFFESILLKEKVKHQLPCPQQLPTVGLEERLFELKKILYERDDVREVNICGMGGIGKTTLARALFSELCASDSFDYTTFIESSSYNDYFTLETVMKHHLYCKGMKVSGTRTPINLSSKKVLFILDDVRNGFSVNEPVDVWFNEVEKSKYDASSIDVRGSRLIVTSREQDVLRNSKSAHIFALALLDEKQSYELLVKHAFPNGHSVPDNFSRDLVKTVALKCGGLPLTLEVIGKFLSGRKDPEEWIFCLEKLDAAGLSNDPIDVRLWKKLKVSYDGLNDHLKQMFLDAATIFNGLPVPFAQASWSTTFNIVSSKSPWKHLIGKSLVYGSVEEDDGGIIRMHEQLRSLGRFIAGSEEEKSRRRIWKSEDAWDLLSAGSDDDNDSNTAKQLKNIHSLRFRFSELDHDTRTDLPIMSPGETETPSVSPNGKVVRISSWPFFKMTKLRYLLLDGVDIVGIDKKPFSSNLIVLIWSSGGKSSELPIQSNPGVKSQLTVLQLRFVLLESVNPLMSKRFPNLKIVELRSAKRMEKISDKIGIFKHVESLSFFWCPRLEEIPSSIGKWEGLVDLVLWDCPYLHTLPELAKLSNLKRLILYRCSSMKRLPESIGRLKSLRILDLHRCLSLEELPQSIGNLSSLESLNLSGKFQELPESFGEHFLALRKLKFKYCENLRSLPPNTFKSCSNLEKLTFLHCHKLQTLAAAEVFDGLKNLKYVLVGWVGVKMEILQELQMFWTLHKIQYNVRGQNGPGIAHQSWNEDANSVDDDNSLQEEEIEESDRHVTSSNEDCRHEFSVRSPSSSKTCTHRLMTVYENMQHRYLALESVHESLKRITVEVESHDQGFSSFLWAHGTDLSAHSYCELSVRTKQSPEGEELARVVLFFNLNAVNEWQTHRCDVDDKELLALVQPGYVVEVTLRAQFLAWQIYAKSGSLELVPADDDEDDDDDDDSELGDEAEDTTDGRRRPLIGSYSNRSIPRRIWELKGEYVSIVCRWPRLEKIYVELDSIPLIATGDESCYNNTWGPICSDMRGSRWSCSPQWAEIGVIGKDGAEVCQRITVSTNMYSGFGWQRHTYLVEDESFLNKIEEGCSVILWIRADLNYPNLVCWDIHFHIRHAQIHLIPELDNLLPQQVNAIFPNGLDKVETFQKLRRGRCLNWKYLSYQNPFVALKQIDVVVEAHECALGPESVVGEVVWRSRQWLSTTSSQERHLLMKMVKARKRDLQEIMEKLFTTLDTNKISESSRPETKNDEEEHSHSVEASESSVDGGVSSSAESDSLPQERVLDIRKAALKRIHNLLHQVRAIECPVRWEALSLLINMQEGDPVSDRQEYQIRFLCHVYIRYLLQRVQHLGERFSWEELSLLMDEKEGRQGDTSVEFSKDTGRGSTWGELSILTPEGDQVGERLVVFTNTPYHQSTPLRKHHYIVDEHNHHTFLKSVKRGYRVVLWLRSGAGWSTAENTAPAVHYAKYASIELILKL